MAFTLFPRLPAEIRCTIFLLAAESEPRIIPILYDEQTLSYRPRIKPPVVLRVNQECRHEAKKIYRELILGPKVNTGCYFNPLKDSIYLRANLQPNRPLNISNFRQRIRAPPTPEVLRREIEESTDHGAIIFNHLLKSSDLEIIFKSFHVNPDLWRGMRRHYVHLRHQLPIHLKELCLVSEKGSGPLSQNSRIRDTPRGPYLDEPVPPERYGVGWNMANSYTASARCINRQDQKNGRPPVLNFRVFAKMHGEED